MELQDPLSSSHTYSSIEKGTDNLGSRTYQVEHRSNSADISTDESNYIPMDGRVKIDENTSSGITTNESNYIPMNGRVNGDSSTSGASAKENKHIPMDGHVTGDKSISSETTNEESNYIPMNGYINGVSGIGPYYYNFERQEDPSKQNYKNTSSKYVTMERPEEPKCSTNDYLHVVP